MFDGPVGPSVTSSLVGSSGMLSPCDSVISGPADQDVDGDSLIAEAEVNPTDGSITTYVSSGNECDSETWDDSYQREIIEGVTVYFGGDLCDSGDSYDSDWEDPEDPLVENMWNNIILT